jgi:hypothetical protein
MGIMPLRDPVKDMRAALLARMSVHSRMGACISRCAHRVLISRPSWIDSRANEDTAESGVCDALCHGMGGGSRRPCQRSQCEC